ncbi:MAG: nucleotidyltransferase domain-containing protein [Candidatus Omnitrophota bacterium]|jgi:predicted nucleotidyltransferase|nr:MAG: nucleotidyltransferase domain-containing protein [Candidatus Omnitrophota bacterium]
MQPEPEIIEKIVQRIVQTVHPLRIILFGSAARGDMRPDSDMDILVVMPNGASHWAVLDDLYLHTKDMPTPIDFVVTTPDGLENHQNDWSMVYYPACREGRVIYDGQ